jgi:hypothetical protein
LELKGISIPFFLIKQKLMEENFQTKLTGLLIAGLIIAGDEKSI